MVGEISETDISMDTEGVCSFVVIGYVLCTCFSLLRYNRSV